MIPHLWYQLLHSSLNILNLPHYSHHSVTHSGSFSCWQSLHTLFIPTETPLTCAFAFQQDTETAHKSCQRLCLQPTWLFFIVLASANPTFMLGILPSFPKQYSYPHAPSRLTVSFNQQSFSLSSLTFLINSLHIISMLINPTSATISWLPLMQARPVGYVWLSRHWKLKILENEIHLPHPLQGGSGGKLLLNCSIKNNAISLLLQANCTVSS